MQDINGNKVANFSNFYVSTAVPVLDANYKKFIFENPSFPISGNDGKSSGDLALFSNIITIDGYSVDAIVTTEEVYQVIINTYDGTPTSGLSDFFELNMKTTASNGFVRFKFQFIKHGTYSDGVGQQVLLQNVSLNSYDIDAAGTGQYQFQEFGGFATYTVSTATSLNQTSIGTSFVRFINNDGENNNFNANSYDGPNASADNYRVKAVYDAISTFEIKCGVAAGNSTAYFYVDFSPGVDFVSPVTFQNPTVVPQTTSDNTPFLKGSYSVSVTGDASYTVSGLTVAVNGTNYTTANGVVYSAGNWSFTPNTMLNGTYDVNVKVTYSSGLKSVNVMDATINELVIDNTLAADNTPPTIVTIERYAPEQEFLTSVFLQYQDYIYFKINFSEPINDLTIDDLLLNGTAAFGLLISQITKTGESSYSVKVSNIPHTQEGILGLEISPLNDIVDDAGNFLFGLTPTSGVNHQFTIGITNSAPVVTDIAKSGLEDTDIIFNTVDFTAKYTDSDGNSLANIMIVDLPSNGTLKLKGISIIPGQQISVSDLNSIIFTPDINWKGISSFNWNAFDGTTYAVVSAIIDINVLEDDTDGDGVIDEQELLNQTDPGDICSFILLNQTETVSSLWTAADCDSDGLSNATELSDGTNPLHPDTDGDGVTDGIEKVDETDPLDQCSLILASQGLPQFTDIKIDNENSESFYREFLIVKSSIINNNFVMPSSEWTAADCDSDGLSNATELSDGTNPLHPDSDGDGVTDGDEKGDTTDPLDQCSLEIASQTLMPSSEWTAAD
ncbi:MAG: hypothetical protein AB7S50_15595, partial [Bacteroidales bacterium]